MKYQLLQLTNPTVGAVATDTLLPLGTTTRKISCGGCNQPTFTVTTSGANTVNLNDAGTYKITYTASLVAGAAGLVTVNLVQNGTVVYTASETATAAGDTVNISLVYVVRALPNFASLLTNLPSTIQFTNTGVALTGGTSNLLIEKVY